MVNTLCGWPTREHGIDCGSLCFEGDKISYAILERCDRKADISLDVNGEPIKLSAEKEGGFWVWTWEPYDTFISPKLTGHYSPDVRDKVKTTIESFLYDLLELSKPASMKPFTLIVCCKIRGNIGTIGASATPEPDGNGMSILLARNWDELSRMFNPDEAIKFIEGAELLINKQGLVQSPSSHFHSHKWLLAKNQIDADLSYDEAALSEKINIPSKSEITVSVSDQDGY